MIEFASVAGNVRPLEDVIYSDNFIDHKDIYKPNEIVPLIKAYLRAEEKGIIGEEANKTIQSLDELISKKKGAVDEYLIMFRQIAVNTAYSLKKVESDYNERISRLEKIRDEKIRELRQYLSKRSTHRAAEKWVSIGLGSVFSYYFGKFLVEFANTPEEYTNDATAAAIFGLIGLLSFAISKYYSHEIEVVSKRYDSKIRNLEDELKSKKRGLYRRAIKLAEISYRNHITGEKGEKDVVNVVSKEDGTKEGIFRGIFKYFLRYIR